MEAMFSNWPLKCGRGLGAIYPSGAGTDDQVPSLDWDGDTVQRLAIRVKTISNLDQEVRKKHGSPQRCCSQ